MRRATLFPLISLLILLIGEIVCFMGHCNHKRKVLTFVAGILYVVGGKYGRMAPETRSFGFHVLLTNMKLWNSGWRIIRPVVLVFEFVFEKYLHPVRRPTCILIRSFWHFRLSWPGRGLKIRFIKSQADFGAGKSGSQSLVHRDVFTSALVRTLSPRFKSRLVLNK